MKKLLSLLATVSLVSTLTTSVVACGNSNSDNNDEEDDDAMAILKEELQQHLVSEANIHLATYLAQNSIIAVDEPNVQLLNIAGMQSLTPENVLLTGQLNPANTQKLIDDIS